MLHADQVVWDDPDDLVVNPTKLVREAWMAEALLDELRRGPLVDPGARRRLRTLERQSLVELGSALSEPATRELARLVSLPDDEVPSDPELHLLQTQIVGWLEGLLAGMRLAASVTAASGP
jgi:hypothetical protein